MDRKRIRVGPVGFMRKLNFAFRAVFVVCLCTSAWAGSINVSGDVYGVWPAGDSVIVEGASRVPAGMDLIIEPGAIIVFKTTNPFEIFGSFSAEGTEADPVVVIPCEGWSGFSFFPNHDHVQLLRFVVIPSDSPEPLRVVMAHSAMIEVDHCDFHAAHSCVEISDGRLWASWNLLRACALFSKAVRIDFLANDVTDACTSLYGNRFNDNIVKVEVPRAGGPLPPSEEFTAALYINGSTNLCLSRNTLSVIAPSSTIGAYFGDVSDAGSQLSALDSSDVSVRSYDGVPKGVFNALSGSLRVLHCNIDVAVIDEGCPYRAAGVLASQLADVIVNSSNVVLDQDSFFFVPLSGALLSVDYITRWSISADLATPPDAPEMLTGGSSSAALLGLDDAITQVEWGSHCYYADPRFLRQGTWGAWRNFDDVAAYYGVDSLSPCIDAGDTQWGYDPDSSPPDIGRYYYRHPQPNDVPDDDYPVVASAFLAPAYPNPFNAATTIPFLLERAGLVRMIIFDVVGREVATVQRGFLGAGSHLVRFNGSGLGSGLYFVQLEVEGTPAARQKVVFLK